MEIIHDAQQAWFDALSKQGGDQQVKELIGGGNYRVNVAKALRAAYLSVKLYLDGKLAIATGSIGPVEIIKLGKGAWDVVSATLDAVRERMHPAEYALCLVVSGHEPQGLTKDLLKTELLEFVKSSDAEKLPWYVGINESFLKEARKLLEHAGGFDQALKDALDRQLVQELDGKLRFAERHFEWGFRLS